MDRKKTESRPCKNCGMLPNQHNYGQYNELLCEIERLPVQIQEAYYNPHTNDTNALKRYIIYYPMDNLQYLEFEYEKTRRETPTRDSLR